MPSTHQRIGNPRRRIATLWLSAAAMVAFAGNSILCRLALRSGDIDAASFTAIRLLSGVLCLLPLAWGLSRSTVAASFASSNWVSALSLFVYAAGFSFAYVRLTAALGALLLFGVVQITMIGVGLANGQRLHRHQWLGLVLAMAGLVTMTWHDVEPPDWLGLCLMASAGVAWGVYSLHGRGAQHPAAMTAGNFLRVAPLSLVMAWILRDTLHATPRGIALAIASGALASGVGYVIWYAALRNLANVHAALVQLSVPVLAALGGVWLLHEPITARLIVAGTAILLGIGISTAKSRKAESAAD